MTPAQERIERMKRLCEKINKGNFGGENHDAITFIGNNSYGVAERFTTGCKAIDYAFGGGVPKGKIIEFFGAESCLDKNTFIPFQITKNGKIVNRKGGTIERLYERFTGNVETGKKQGRHLQKQECGFEVLSSDFEDKIIRNKIIGVVKTGKKVCYQVEADGKTIITTLDHKFKTEYGFKALSELNIGDNVFVHTNKRIKGQKERDNYPEKLVKYHFRNKIKIVNGYTYYRVRLSHAVIEASLNNLSLDDYIEKLNTENKETIDSFIRLPEGMQVHHIDENTLNNDLSNLILISSENHGTYHSGKNLKNLSFVSFPVKIDSIVCVGEKETYDIKCDFPNNNFVANNFIVHNCGKSTLVYHIIANHQKNYPDEDVALFDTEFSFDTAYAGNLGVDVASMLVSQPETGIQALNIAKALVEEEDSRVKLIIIDSVAALTTKSDDEGDIGDQTMAEQARMVSQAMRVLNAQCGRRGVTLIVTNQVREAVGIMYGDKQTTPAGKALKHYAHIRAKLTRMKQIKQGEVSIGVESKLDCVKNKVAPPFRRAEYTITFGLGIDPVLGVVDLAIDKGVISKKAAWFSFDGEQLANGKPNLVEFLRANKDIYDKIEEKLNVILGSATIGTSVLTDEEKAVAEMENADDPSVEVESV